MKSDNSFLTLLRMSTDKRTGLFLSLCLLVFLAYPLLGCDPPPKITGFSPSEVKQGQHLTIKGENFGGLESVIFPDPELSPWWEYGIAAEIIGEPSDTEIVVKVPYYLKNGSNSVRVTTKHGKDSDYVKILGPSIDDINPGSVSSRELIKITGERLGCVENVLFSKSRTLCDSGPNEECVEALDLFHSSSPANDPCLAVSVLAVVPMLPFPHSPGEYGGTPDLTVTVKTTEGLAAFDPLRMLSEEEIHYEAENSQNDSPPGDAVRFKKLRIMGSFTQNDNVDCYLIHTEDPQETDPPWARLFQIRPLLQTPEQQEAELEIEIHDGGTSKEMVWASAVPGAKFWIKLTGTGLSSLFSGGHSEVNYSIDIGYDTIRDEAETKDDSQTEATTLQVNGLQASHIGKSRLCLALTPAGGTVGLADWYTAYVPESVSSIQPKVTKAGLLSGYGVEITLGRETSGVYGDLDKASGSQEKATLDFYASDTFDLSAGDYYIRVSTDIHPNYKWCGPGAPPKSCKEPYDLVIQASLP